MALITATLLGRSKALVMTTKLGVSDDYKAGRGKGLSDLGWGRIRTLVIKPLKCISFQFHYSILTFFIENIIYVLQPHPPSLPPSPRQLL